MNKIEFDVDKNRIYLKLVDGGIAEMKWYYRVVKHAITMLEEGFSCLTDISDYDPESMEDEKLLVKIQVLLWKSGMGKVVRVRKSRSISGHLQLEKASIATGYSAKVVRTIEEAKKILDTDLFSDYKKFLPNNKPPRLKLEALD